MTIERLPVCWNIRFGHRQRLTGSDYRERPPEEGVRAFTILTGTGQARMVAPVRD